jgi:hypothetical protein
MSRTQKTGTSNSPVRKYLSFKGSKGQLAYYDKDSKEDDKNVYLDSLDFVLLDIKSSITGFNESSSSQISSNLLEPYSVGKEPFIVKTKINGSYGVIAQGIWKEIKAEVDGIGGKFTSNVFAIADVGQGMEIVRIELSGAGLTPWINFQSELSNSDEAYDKVITIKRGKLCTRRKGKTEAITEDEYKKILTDIKKNPLATRPVLFYEPAFQGSDLSEDLADLAVQNDAILQKYFAESGVATEPAAQPESNTTQAKEDPAQFRAPVAAAGTEEVDDDDLPF